MYNNKIVPYDIVHEDYEKISDDILYVSKDVVLRMNVVLSRKNKLNEKVSFHKDFIYDSDKYVNKNKLITTRRSFDYFLSLESIYSSSVQVYFTINIFNIMQFRVFLNNVYRWFNDKKFERLYAIKDNKLIILGRVDPIEFYSGNYYIKAEPILINYENNQSEGIRLYFNSDTMYTDISLYKLSGLVYLINTADIYQYALGILSYIGAPPMGSQINVINDDGYMEESINNGVQAKEGRKMINNTKSKSFFDKMKEM